MIDFAVKFAALIAVWLLGVLLGVRIGREDIREIDGVPISRVRWLLVAYQAGKVLVKED